LGNVEIYTTRFCPFCIRAKNLLKAKGVSFAEIPIDTDPDLRREMTSRSGGGLTVPQIFIDGELIGGCDDLVALEQRGQLDKVLAI
jgi:glutaredoxin 3